LACNARSERIINRGTKEYKTVTTEIQFNRHSSTLKLQIVGALIILLFGLYGGGSALASNGQVSLGLVLLLTNSAAAIVIGVLLRSVIALDAPFTANVYLAARVVEGLLLGVGAIVLALTDNVELNSNLYRLGMIALGLGSIGFCRWLLWSRRIHALHAWLGLIGYPLLVLAMIAGFFGLEVWSYVLLVPGAMFELTFGLYLLFVGLGSKLS
jgi:hypothetical protein